MSEKDYLAAVNNRCSISRESKCFECKVVNTSSVYISQLKAELDKYRGEAAITRITNTQLLKELQKHRLPEGQE